MNLADRNSNDLFLISLFIIIATVAKKFLLAAIKLGHHYKHLEELINVWQSEKQDVY